MNGQKDDEALAVFVCLETASEAALRLTRGHHVKIEHPGVVPMEIPSEMERVGGLMRVVLVTTTTITATLEPVVAKNLVPGTGLFNPYKLGGTIVVDGVAASVHSTWALEVVFEVLGVPLPVGYQALFAPVRGMYKALGASSQRRMEWIINAVAEAGNRRGGTANAHANTVAVTSVTSWNAQDSCIVG